MRANTMTRFILGLVAASVPAIGMAQAVQPASSLAGQIHAPYLTGGADQDELAQLTEQAAGYNVKILFAERGGAFIAGVQVTIGAPGGAPVLQIASAGPVLFAKLPPGRYEIKATHEGVSQASRLSVGTKGRSEMALRW